MAGVKEALSGITISDNERLTADSIASLIDIASIEKNITEGYQRAIENKNYNEILGLFNDKSLVTSVGHFFGVDNKIYVDRAISLLEGDLRDELSELVRLSHAALPCRVIAVSGCPPASDTRLAGKDFLASVTVLVRFLERHRARTDNGEPFCQDEKTRLPAEMLQLGN
ncbi:hypothetical protein [Senegalimassilia anaerobia]